MNNIQAGGYLILNQINRLFSTKVLQYQSLLAEKKAAVGLGPTRFNQLLTRQLGTEAKTLNSSPVKEPLDSTPAQLAQPAPVPLQPNKLKINTQTDYTSLIQQAAENFRLDPDLIRAVIQVESRFEPEAVSSAGAMGLMQLMPATAASYAVTDPFDPGQNIMAGANVLRQHLDRFSDLRLALAAYNAGPGRIGGLAVEDPDDPDQYEKISPAVRSYVAKVLDYYDQYNKDPVGKED